jgi:hypothetical protein
LGTVGVSAREREPLRGVGVGGDGRHRGGPRRKHGGQILLHPGAYFGRVFLPSLVSWLARLGVTAVFLAAYAIPLTFHTVMAVTGGSSIPNVTSVAADGGRRPEGVQRRVAQGRDRLDDGDRVLHRPAARHDGVDICSGS